MGILDVTKKKKALSLERDYNFQTLKVNYNTQLQPLSNHDIEGNSPEDPITPQSVEAIIK